MKRRISEEEDKHLPSSLSTEALVKARKRKGKQDPTTCSK